MTAAKENSDSSENRESRRLSRQNGSREPSYDEKPNLAAEMSLFRECSVVILVSMAQFATQISVGGVVSILHVVGNEFNITDESTLSWAMASYSLTVGTFILPSGRLGDLYGYKKMLMIGFGWYALWTLVAGLSVFSNYTLFVFARVLQGIGPALCLPNGLAVLGSIYPPGRRKNMAFAIFGCTAPLGSVTGSAFYALFSLAWWPWAFFSFTMVLVVTIVVGYFVIPFVPRKTIPSGLRDQIVRLDPLGSISGVASLVLIDFAWNQAPLAGWQSPYVIVTLILGVLLVPVFFYIEIHVASYPLLPFECLNSDIGTILASLACGWACFGIFLFYIYQIFEVSRHGTPLMAAAWISTNAVSGAVAAILTGLLLNILGPPLAMVLALVAYVVGTALLATVPVHQTYWLQTFLSLVIVPFGMDISFPAATVILSNAVPLEHQGIGASLVNTVVNFSISLGLGFAGTVEVHVNDGGNTPEQLLKGFRGALYMGIGLAGLGLVISLLYWLKTIFRKDKGVKW